MAIYQQPDSLSLSGNMKKFIITSGSTVSFKLNHGGDLILDSTYQPGTDGRVIIDVQRLVEERLSFTLNTANPFYIQNGIAKTFVATVDGQSIPFHVIRSGVANLPDTSSNWLAANFLTWQPTQKFVSYYSPEWLTYYAGTSGFLKLKAYFEDGSTQSLTLGSLTSGNVFTANLQYALIAGLLGNRYPTHYEVWVENSGGTRLTYIQQYIYSKRKSANEQWFLFENSLGGIDTLRAGGETDFTGEHEHHIAVVGEESTEFKIDTTRIYRQNTGHLDAYERRWLMDMFPARKKRIYYNSSFRDIVVTESNIDYSNSDLPSNYQFSFRFADDNKGLLFLIRNLDTIPPEIVIPNLSSPDFRLPPRLSEYPRIPLGEGVLLPAFEPYSEVPGTVTVGSIIETAKTEALNMIPGGDGTPGTGGQLVNVVRSESMELASDYNIFSAFATLKAISEALEDYDVDLDTFLEELKGYFLRKDTPDTAAEVITFVKGIISQAEIQTTELEATGNITSLATVQAQIIKALVSAEIQDMILKGTLSSESFTSGFLGNGFRLKYSDSRWILEVDKIVVRQAMEIFELIVQKTTHQGGQVIHSPFGGKLTAVAHGGTYWRCEHDSADDCIEGAFILCQNFKIGSGNQNPTGQTTFQGVSVKRYWRRVTSAGRGWFNLSVSTAESGSDMPQVGDDVIVLGHESNPDWQNAIMLASTGGNTPYIAHYAGINTFSLVGKEVVREGNLSGIVDAVFGILSGYGLYSSNVFLRGVFKLANGDDVGGILGQLQTEVSAIPGQIDLAVKSVPLGLTNLLRNYNADLGLDFWSLNFDTWEQGGFSGYDAQNNVKKIRTGFVEIGQGKYNIELSDGYKVQILFYDGTHAGVQNNTGKINGDSVTAGSTVKYVRFALERVDGENLLPGDYGKAGFSLTMGTVISDSGSVILPHIVSITLPQNSYSVQKDGTLTPNTSITLNLSNGTTRQTTINWGNIDTGTVGSFTTSSSDYVIPSGVALTPKPSASIIVNVTAGAPELTIASVVQPSQVTVEQYGTPVMPSTITLNISDGSTRTVAVAWGSYNTNTIGTYTISGSYDLPAGITGAKPAVSISLNVVTQTVTVVSVTQPGTVYVAQYGTPALPSTVQLNLSNSTSQNVSVSWSSYNTNTIGTYTLTGSYNLPAGVSGSKPAVSLTLTVTSAGAGVVDLMPVMVGRTDLFTTGSDATGNYVRPIAINMDWDMFNSKLSDIVPGTSKLYARYAWGSDSVTTNVRVRKSGSFGALNLQMQSGGTKISATITDSGSDQFGMYLGGDTIRIYNLELRNDGNAPAWW